MRGDDLTARAHPKHSGPHSALMAQKRSLRLFLLGGHRMPLNALGSGCVRSCRRNGFVCNWMRVSLQNLTGTALYTHPNGSTTKHALSFWHCVAQTKVQANIGTDRLKQQELDLWSLVSANCVWFRGKKKTPHVRGEKVEIHSARKSAKWKCHPLEHEKEKLSHRFLS